MTELAINVLGELQVVHGTDVVPLPPSKKTRALLAYLAVKGRPERRERLCELFWDVPDDPRGALRWSLSKLRPILNDPGCERLATDRNSVKLETDGIAFDFTEVAALRPGEVGSLTTERLIAFAARFRGSFLEDLSLPRCPEFEAWRVHHANELDVLRIRLLRTLIDRLTGDPEAALPYLLALRKLDPDDDSLVGRADELILAARQNAREIASSPAAVATPRYEREPPPAGPALTQPEVRFCKARDGVRLAYASSGQGAPIVRAAHWMSHLQHELNSPVWRHWVQELSRSNQLIRYDERCNGMSDWHADDLSFEAMVADLEAVVDASGLDRFTLLGISQSCAVSVAYAVRHPERVSGLILYAGYVKGWRKRGDAHEIATREALATLMRVGWGQNNPVFRQLFTSRFIPGAEADQIASFDELQRITVSPENAWRLQNVFGDIDVSDLLPRVSVPTLVLHARGDQIAPYASGRSFATTISGARLVELDSANHILMENEPAFRTFVGEVRGFANMVAARSQTPVSTRKGPTSRAPEGRRQITALTCEIINPDSFLDYTDPEGERDLDPFREQAIELVARHGGTMVGTAHNEFTAAFGADRAREDHALQACRAALDLIELTKTVGGGALRARIGIDTGEVVIQAAQDGVGLDVSGAPVTVSRRLAHTLRRPVVATTGRTHDAAGGLVEMSRLTREEAPSFPADWRVFELGRERREISRWQLRAPITGDRLIGRDTELDVLADAARKARLGQGQAVAVLAEAGLGKSRTTHDFLASPDASGFQLIECGAQELDQAVAWSLLKNFVRSLFGINYSDTAEVVTSKMHQGLGHDSAELLPPLLFVLDLPATGQVWTSLSALGKSQRVQEAVMRAVALVTENEPTALLLEDLHWADAESLDVIRGVAGATRTLPLLMIAISRPEGCAQWLLSEPFWQLRLGKLGRESTRDLVGSLLGVDESVVDVGHVIAQRTGGVPLFVEEVVRELAQSGQIVGERGAYKAVGPVTDIAVPPTVQSVIAARLGKLSEQDRAVVEAAAVIGRETPADLLQVVVGLPTTAIHESLSRLISAGFLAERPSAPVRTARFEHALIEEVAYRGMLSKTRRMLHKRVFDALDRDGQGDVERLAEHALRAELWPAGARYLLQAAQKALARSAHGAALEMVARGLDALKRLPENTERNRLELKLQEARGLGWMAARGWGSPEVGEAYARAEELCRLLADRTELFVVLRGRAQYYMIGGQPELAQKLAMRCQAVCADTQDRGVLIETGHMMWTNGFFMGDYPTAVDSAENAVQLYDAKQHHGLTYQYSGHDPGVCSRCFSGLAQWQLGRLDVALARTKHAVELAEQLGHPLSTALAYWGQGYMHLFRSEPQETLGCAYRQIEICDEFALPLIRSQGRFQAGWAMAKLGDLEQGIRAMTEGIEAIRETGAEMGMPYLLALLAEAVAEQGDLRHASALLDEAISGARRNGARFQFSEILRLKGKVAARSGEDSAEVEALLRSAIRSAARQSAIIPELRAANELAKSLISRNKISDGRAVLAPYESDIQRLSGTVEGQEAAKLL